MPTMIPSNLKHNVNPRRDFGAVRFGRVGSGFAILVLCLGLGGCVKTIFRRGDPRTQYDRYDSSRNQFAPDYIEDEYGRLEPNLRGRLLVKN
jgi:hypothetical protein